jgi:hypothetical protein
LRKLLGLDCSETYIRKTEICPKNPQFLPHQEYRIYCNIIDSSQKLVNGEESKLIASFIPKNGEYGDLHKYISDEKIALNQCDYSKIEISIKNHDDEMIEFDTLFSVRLSLE